MPETATLMTFAAATMALVLIVGPNLLYIVTRSAADGRRAGLASALGVETGTLVHLTAAAAGASALIASSATALTALRYAASGGSPRRQSVSPARVVRRRPVCRDD
jgi:threonine/homoserine/homoserine lactone efflux protein